VLKRKHQFVGKKRFLHKLSNSHYHLYHYYDYHIEPFHLLQTIPCSFLNVNGDWSVGWCLTALSVQTGRIMPWVYKMYVSVGPERKQHKQNEKDIIIIIIIINIIIIDDCCRWPNASMSASLVTCFITYSYYLHSESASSSSLGGPVIIHKIISFQHLSKKYYAQ